MKFIKAIKPATLEQAIAEAVNGLLPKEPDFKIDCAIDGIEFDEHEVVMTVILSKAPTLDKP